MSRAARPARWSAAVVVMHWAGALLILALLAIGWVMRRAGLSAATDFPLFQFHKSLGFVVLALTAVRIVARFGSTEPPLPASPHWERALARATQVSLYALTLFASLAGWALVSASPLPIPTRFFDLFVIPNIAPANLVLFKAATLAHAVSVYLIAALTALHVAGALKHHLIDRDDVLKRMLALRPARERP